MVYEAQGNQAIRVLDWSSRVTSRPPGFTSDVEHFVVHFIGGPLCTRRVILTAVHSDSILAVVYSQANLDR